MQQSRTLVSRGGRIVKVAVAALIGVAGLTVVGVDNASAATAQPTVSSIGNGQNNTGACPASITGYTGSANGGNNVVVCGTGFTVTTATTVTHHHHHTITTTP